MTANKKQATKYSVRYFLVLLALALSPNVVTQASLLQMDTPTVNNLLSLRQG